MYCVRNVCSCVVVFVLVMVDVCMWLIRFEWLCVDLFQLFIFVSVLLFWWIVNIGFLMVMLSVELVMMIVILIMWLLFGLRFVIFMLSQMRFNLLCMSVGWLVEVVVLVMIYFGKWWIGCVDVVLFGWLVLYQWGWFVRIYNFCIEFFGVFDVIFFVYFVVCVCCICDGCY